MSIISEALKKAEKDRNKVMDSKEYLSKILGPEPDIFSHKKEALENTSAESHGRHPSHSLAISGILIISAIIFLSAINILIISAPDVRQSALTASTKTSSNGLEAEAYTTVMQSDIKLIERRTGILDKMGRVLTGTSVIDEFSSNFTLNGIIYDANNSWAIINNKMVKSGDMLDGAKILAILPQKAVLTFKNETFDLNVK